MASMSRLWSGRHIRVSATWVSAVRGAHSTTPSLIHGLAKRPTNGSRDGDGPLGVRRITQHPLSFGSKSELAKAFLTEVLAFPLVERAKHLRAVLEAAFDEHTGLYMAEKILESLCDSAAPSRVHWPALAAVVYHCDTVELLSASKSKALLKYLEFVLERLSEDELVGSADVLNVLRLVRFNHRLSLDAVSGLFRARALFRRELPWLATDVATRPQLELIHALGLKVSRQSFSDSELVTLCYDNLATLLPSYEMPELEWQRMLVARVADAVVQLNVYHEAFLSSFAEYLTCLVHAKCLQGIDDAQFYLYLFAYMGHRAEELFGAVKAALESADAGLQVGESDNVHSYIVLNWSFLAQGVEPPAHCTSRMWHLLRHWEQYPHSGKALRSPYQLQLLEQLMAMAPPDLAWLRQRVLVTLGDVTGFSKVTRIVRQRLPGVGVDCALDAGCVWIYALVDPETGFIVPWPEDLDPRQVRPHVVLPGRAVALLFTHATDALRKVDRCNGVVARKVSLLQESGWAVARVHVQRDYTGARTMKWCTDSLIDAISKDL